MDISLIDTDYTRIAESPNFPGFTEITQSKCLCIPYTYLPAVKAYYIGHWEVKLGMPLFVAFLILFILVIYICAAIHINSVLSAIFLIILLIPLALSIYAYIKVITIGPGYFPFFWSQIKDTPQPMEEDLRGVYTTDEQFSWALGYPKPPRTITSRKARRFVVRPDHYCLWASTFIGKRNNKAFCLMTLYMTIFGILYMLFSIPLLYDFSRSVTNAWTYLVAFADLVTLGFTIFTGKFVVTSRKLIKMGLTRWETWNNVPVDMYAKDEETNIKEVFGEGSLCKLLTPDDPWEGKQLSEVMKGQFSYYD